MVDAEGTDTRKIYPLFKHALSAQPQIIAVAGSELGLGEGTGWSQSGFEYNDKHKQVYEYYVDNDYIRLMGMQLALRWTMVSVSPGPIGKPAKGFNGPAGVNIVGWMVIK